MRKDFKLMTESELVEELKKILILPYVNWLSMLGRDTAFRALHAELDERGFTGARPPRRLFKLTSERISAALYEIDPMYQCCKENNCSEEYDKIARRALEKTQQQTPLPTALKKVLTMDYSLKGTEAHRIDQVIDRLCQMSPDNSKLE